MTALSADLTTIALLQALAGLNMNEPLEHRSILDMTTERVNSEEARKEGNRRFPMDRPAANSFHRSAMGWVPPEGLRLTRSQREAVAQGAQYRAALSPS